MPVNPALKPELMKSPAVRANALNDPNVTNSQGYFSYDLTHQEFISPLFGKIHPTCHVDTIPGDRITLNDNHKLILNTINANFLSTINEYVDYFYIPLRSVFPTNYEKLIPNPTKGVDLPNSALPQFPFSWYINSLVNNDTVAFSNADFNVTLKDYFSAMSEINKYLTGGVFDYRTLNDWALSYLTLAATILSRGELLDYLGVQFDNSFVGNLQEDIDEYFAMLFEACTHQSWYGASLNPLRYYQLEPTMQTADLENISMTTLRTVGTRSEWRQAIADILEKGGIINFGFENLDDSDAEVPYVVRFVTAINNLVGTIRTIFSEEAPMTLTEFDATSDPFSNNGFINISKVLAYQQVVAQYYSNDSVDNIFNSDLYMQLLRGVMFPSSSGFSQEPTFDYNGVPTEYDYISTGAAHGSFWGNANLSESSLSRQYLFGTLMFMMRRSLRYGDYFATARPDMLAVGDLQIAADADGMISPVDVTKNLLMQRYLNFANYHGASFLPSMAAEFGVTPSDVGTYPRFIAHRKVDIENRVTNNTADNQGHQTTNLVGYSADQAFDVFIDDFGVLLALASFDVLPVYQSGIDPTYHLADRFDYFNPMLQGIGDQQIRLSEIHGYPKYRNDVFGYTMRNGEYKYKISRAHGAFLNSLPGFMLQYPLKQFFRFDLGDDKISPEFIRDKPIYLDPVLPRMTGISPGEYYHFICSVTNELHLARKMQKTPPILF